MVKLLIFFYIKLKDIERFFFNILKIFSNERHTGENLIDFILQILQESMTSTKKNRCMTLD